MLALVKTAAGPGLELRDVPMPAIGINDVLIRVHKTGICGTDLHIESWDPWAAKTIHPPLVVGHEFVGEIVEVGSNVADFSPGDLVSGEGHVVCGRCRHCLAGRRNLCAKAIGLGVGRDGAFAEYVSLPMTNVWHHWHGHQRGGRRDLRPVRQRGPHRARLPGPRRGRADHRGRPDRADGHGRRAPRRGTPRGRQRAQRLPAGDRDRDGRHARYRPARADPRVGLRRARHGRGLRRRVSRCRATRRRCGPRSAAMAHGGGIAILGIPTEEISLDVNAIVFKMLTLRGIYGREMYETWYKMTVMLQSGLDITPAITHRFGFREFEAAFAAARAGDSGKVIMDWTS